MTYKKDALFTGAEWSISSNGNLLYPGIFSSGMDARL